MADLVSVKVEGIDEIQRSLRQLDAKVEVKVIKQTVRAAARPIITEARRRTTSKRVAKALKVISVKAKPDGTVTAHVGLPSKGPGFIGLFLELGTGPRVQKSTGRRTGSVRARPFLGPALVSQRDAVVERFGVEIRKRIAKYMGT